MARRADVPITKTELAKELGISKARVSQYVKAGLPVREDGRVDRARAVAWVQANVVSPLGGWGTGMREKDGGQPVAQTQPERNRPEKQQVPEAMPAEPTRLPSAVRVAHKICFHLREIFPEIIAGGELAGGDWDLQPAEEAFVFRIFVLAITTHLVEGWCEDLLAVAAQKGLAPLPDIDWAKHFGEDAEAARSIYSDYRSRWFGTTN